MIYFNFISTRPLDKELDELAMVLKDGFKQLGRLKSIRSIPSRYRALKLLENDYKVLVYDL